MPDDQSGMLVYPKMPVPKNRDSDPVVRRSSGKLGGGRKGKILLGAAIAGGLIVGFVLRPLVWGDARVSDLEKKAADADAATASARAHGAELQADLDKAVKR